MAEKSLYAGGKPVSAGKLVTQFLSNGATHQAVGNYSSGVEQFQIVADVGSQQLHLARMIVHIEDVGNFDSGRYGNNIILTNGIHIVAYDADGTTVLKDLDGNEGVLTNSGWGALCHDVTLHDYGLGNNSVTARWTFARTGKPLTLSSGQMLSVDLNDDFTGLEAHTFMVQGYYA